MRSRSPSLGCEAQPLRAIDAGENAFPTIFLLSRYQRTVPASPLSKLSLRLPAPVSRRILEESMA